MLRVSEVANMTVICSAVLFDRFFQNLISVCVSNLLSHRATCLPLRMQWMKDP